MSTDSPTSLIDRVREALDKNGQALELRTARAVLSAGLPVLEAFSYRDPIEGGVREGDVAAAGEIQSESGTIHAVSVFECKNSPEASWVGVRGARRRARSLSDPRLWTAHASGIESMRELPGEFFELFPDSRTPCSTVVSPFTAKNTALAAVRQCLSAAAARLTTDMIPQTDESGYEAYRGLAFAVVVTTATLFECELDAGGNILVHPADRIDVVADIGDGVMRSAIIVREAQLAEVAAAFATACA